MPEVAHLLGRVEAHLDKLERRERALVAKAELQEGRLEAYRQRRRSRSRSRAPAAYELEDEEMSIDEGEGATGRARGNEELKMVAMRQKKDRLSYQVDRLTLQASQRERQLRMSVAGR